MKPTAGLAVWIYAIAFLSFSEGIVWAQRDDLAAGDRLFHFHCAECHGVDGTGGRGPDLTRGVYRHGSTDEELFQTIAKGVPGTPMPSTSLPDRQLRQIVMYVQDLAGATRHPIGGNAEAGQKLFRGKGACTKCHMVRGEGGNLGPDLTFVGSLRSPEHLRACVLRPDGQISSDYWIVKAMAANGTIYSGIKMNEDTYTIQMIDVNENLHSLAKKDLRSLVIEKRKSFMPSFAGVFADSELDDLVAYLYSLERPPKLP